MAVNLKQFYYIRVLLVHLSIFLWLLLSSNHFCEKSVLAFLFVYSEAVCVCVWNNMNH